MDGLNGLVRGHHDAAEVVVVIAAIQSEDILVVASAIGAERIFDEVLRTGREHAGREDRQVLLVAAIQGHLRDGSVLDHRAEVGSFGFEQRHLARHFDDFRHLAEGHLRRMV